MGSSQTVDYSPWGEQPEQVSPAGSEHGRTGEGAASALAQLISEGETQRRHNGEHAADTHQSHP